MTKARAAVADPPVLILDEATSSIDTRTEALAQRGMDALMKGRTSFVIAHRLSTVRNADCIMVLEHGRIIERGTHESLMEQRGRYYQLYTGNAIGDRKLPFPSGQTALSPEGLDFHARARTDLPDVVDGAECPRVLEYKDILLVQ